MDLVTQTIGIRCRAAILKIERESDRIRSRFRRYTMTEADKRSTLEVRAYRLGQQFRNYKHDPFIDWDHPLAKELSHSFLMGAGHIQSSAA